MNSNQVTFEAVIVDLDGTLVDVKEIRYYVEARKKDFDAFHTASASCKPILHVLERVQQHSMQGRKIVVVSGRKNKFKRLTEFWLALWNCPSDYLYLREDYDNRNDVVIKTEMFNNLPTRLKVIEAIDDKDEMLVLWLKLGVPRVLDARKKEDF